MHAFATLPQDDLNDVPAAAGPPRRPATTAWVADGVRLYPFCTRRYLDEVVTRELRTGFARSGRGRERFEISGGGFSATGTSPRPSPSASAALPTWSRCQAATV